MHGAMLPAARAIGQRKRHRTQQRKGCWLWVARHANKDFERTRNELGVRNELETLHERRSGERQRHLDGSRRMPARERECARMRTA